MTLDELKIGFKKIGLDTETEFGMRVLDESIRRFGKSILRAKRQRCDNCWMKDKRIGCNRFCDMYGMPDDPFKVGLANIVGQNDIRLFSYIYMFVIPVYEEFTGEKDTIEKLKLDYKIRWKKEHPENQNLRVEFLD